MPPRSPSPLPLSRRLLYGTAVFALLFGVVEIGVRLFWTSLLEAGDGGLLMEPHPSRLWALKPGETEAFGARIRVNSDRLRETSIEGHSLRALTLGDSSVFGHGLNDPDTPHQALEDALAARGVQCDVLSGATPGYSSIQALRLLDEVGWDQTPDLLIIGTLWSDTNLRERSDGDWMTEFDQPRQSFHTWMSVHLKTWDMFTDLLTDQQEIMQSISWETQEVNRDYRNRRVSPTHYAYNLDRMLHQAIEHGAAAIMLQPCNNYLLARGGDPTSTIWSAYFETMETIAERRSVPLVKGCEVIVQAGLSIEEAFLDEMHPSAATNRLYADALADALTQAGWPTQSLVPDASAEVWTYTVPDLWVEQVDNQKFVAEENPSLYFEWGEQTLLLPLTQIESSVPDPEKYEHAGMEISHFQPGLSVPRRPIRVRQIGPERYEVVQGQATFSVAEDAGWEAIPADIVEP